MSKMTKKRGKQTNQNGSNLKWKETQTTQGLITKYNVKRGKQTNQHNQQSQVKRNSINYTRSNYEVQCHMKQTN